MRDGIEDYEWLAMAERKKGRAAAEEAAGQLIRSMTEYERSRLAEALERR